jgi:hypothetical protein
MPDEGQQTAVVILDARWSMAEYDGDEGIVMGIQFYHPSTGLTLLCMNEASLAAMRDACIAALAGPKHRVSASGGHA